MSEQRFIFKGEDNMLPNMLQIQIHKQVRFSAAHYVLIYKGLQLLLQNGNIPMSKYRISNKKSIIDTMISNRFIEECDDKRKIISEYVLHKDTKYYTIGTKGFEYMRAFENLEKLFES